MIKLSADEKNGIALAARHALARKSYADYFLLVNPGMKLYPHTKLITDKLQKIVNGEQHFYIVEMPPQHGKSLTITSTFPAYYLMKHPDKKVMIATYSKGLYSQFANTNRQDFNEWGPSLFGLRTYINTADKFTIAKHKGEFFATSILGAATGHSADLLIVDDPVKDAEEANSPTIQKKVWEEWTKTFSTRLQDNSSVVVIMTRWRTDDLAGRLLDSMSRNWEEIKLPAIATDLKPGETDAIGRHNGEALCPELHSLKDLLIQKKEMGSQGFAALYQQSPSIEDGNIFKRKWVRFYVPDRQTMARLHLTDKDVKILPRHLQETVQGWDATFKSKANDDFVAGQVWSRRDGDFYLRPGWCHKRLSFTETLDAIRTMTRFYPQATVKLVEDKANGPAIIDTLKHEIPGIIAVSPGADSKEARAASVSPLWESGNVYVPHPRWKPEVEDWLEEIFSFPNAPHDDNVDSMVYCLQRLHKAKRRPIGVIKF